MGAAGTLKRFVSLDAKTLVGQGALAGLTVVDRPVSSILRPIAILISLRMDSSLTGQLGLSGLNRARSGDLSVSSLSLSVGLGPSDTRVFGLLGTNGSVPIFLGFTRMLSLNRSLACGLRMVGLTGSGSSSLGLVNPSVSVLPSMVLAALGALRIRAKRNGGKSSDRHGGGDSRD